MTALALLQESAEPGERGDEPLVFPCSVAQEQLWFLNQIEPGNPALNVAVRWQLDGEVRPGLVEQAFGLLIDRHESLRTVFFERDGLPFQRVLPYLPFRLGLVDLTGLPESGRPAEATRIGLEIACGSFDLTQPPLLRATLVRLAESRWLLLVTVHHIVSDGWSIGVLAGEVGETCRALHHGRAADLPALAIQYGDYAVWQKEWLTGPALRRQRDYWLAKLAGVPHFELVPDRPRSAVPTRKGKIVSMILARSLTDRLQDFARVTGCTFFMVALAAFKTLLYRRTGQTDLAIGTQVAGRTEAGLENLIGPFINTLVLRVDLAGDPSFADLTDRVRETVVGALTHAEMPFPLLIAEINPARVPGRHPLFSVNFIFQRSFIANADYGPFALTDLPSLSPGALHDLTVFMVERPVGWYASCEYSTDLFRAETATDLLESFHAVLAQIVATPDAKISTFPGFGHVPSAVLGTPEGAIAAAGVGVPGEPPRSNAAMEQKLAAIWQGLLGTVAPPPVSANFFELGGHSLLAARMLARVGAEFGKKVRLNALLNDATIAGLANLLRQEEQAPPQNAAEDHQIVALQPAGWRPPIIAIDNTGLFYPIAHRLGRDQPFFAVRRYDPEVPQDLPVRALEDIAADYIRIIRRVRPHGPYGLVGFCVRGSLAYEIAQQLRAAGEDVPMLAVIDTWAPGYLSRMSGMRALLAPIAYRLQLGVLRLIGDGASLRAICAHCIRRVGEIFGLTAKVETFDPRDDWFHLYIRAALLRYRPKPYEGRVLILTRDLIRTGCILDPHFGWDALLAGWHRYQRFSSLGAVRGANPNRHDLHLHAFGEEAANLIAVRMADAMAAAAPPTEPRE